MHKPSATGIIFKICLNFLLLPEATWNWITLEENNLVACQLLQISCKLNIKRFCSPWVRHYSLLDKYPELLPKTVFQVKEYNLFKITWKYSKQFKCMVLAYPLQLQMYADPYSRSNFYLDLIKELSNASVIYLLQSRMLKQRRNIRRPWVHMTLFV